MTNPGIRDLRCEYMHNPIGLDRKNPRLSWKMTSEKRNNRMRTCRLQVLLQEKVFWDTGEIPAPGLPVIVYDGPDLSSFCEYRWRVSITDNDGNESGWSETASFETTMLSPSEWDSEWIEPVEAEPEAEKKPAPYLRSGFMLPATAVESARLCITCHGVYSVYINGKHIHPEEALSPGFSSYHHRLYYRTYDVGEYLENGYNAIGVILGDGWWRGKITPMAMKNVYGKSLALLCRLRVLLADGSIEELKSDGSWRSSTGAVISSDLMDGEAVDFRKEPVDWNKAGFDDSSWKPVKTADFGFENIHAAMSPPALLQEEFKPVLLETPDGKKVLDFGQNISGIVRMKARGPAGHKISLTHGETLDEKGCFTMKNLNPGKFVSTVFKTEDLVQQDSCILRGTGETELFQPLFTFHGFRYVLVENYPGSIDPDDFTAIAIYSEMKQTGSFDCSDPKLNRLQRNIEWSQKGNFLDIPTDCPQRERSGYTGDAQVFARTGSYLMDTAIFFHKWLLDVESDQRDDGKIPVISPDPSLYMKGGMYNLVNGSAGWGDAITIIPWTLYEIFGDNLILSELYPAMKSWVDYMEDHARKKRNGRKEATGTDRFIRDSGFHFGEWAEPGSNYVIELFRSMIFARPSVATAFFAYSSELLSRAAGVLGKTDDRRYYERLSANIKEAWVKRFVKAGGRMVPDTQATYVRAIAFDLVPEEMKRKAAGRLAGMVRGNKYAIGTGFLATPFVCHVLSDYGFVDDAYRLLMNEKYPSWLYPVTKGATTVWEFWDAVRENGKLRMSSHNHYSPGSIGGWMFEKIGGIRQEAPGFTEIRLEPLPGGGLNRASARFDSVHGQITSSWRIEDGVFSYDVEIPPGTSADICFPVPPDSAVFENGERIPTEVRNGKPCITAGSGIYSFRAEYR